MATLPPTLENFKPDLNRSQEQPWGLPKTRNSSETRNSHIPALLVKIPRVFYCFVFLYYLTWFSFVYPFANILCITMAHVYILFRSCWRHSISSCDFIFALTFVSLPNNLLILFSRFWSMLGIIMMKNIDARTVPYGISDNKLCSSEITKFTTT